MLSTLGLGGVLTFDSKQAETSMGRVFTKFTQIDNKAGKFGRTVKTVTAVAGIGMGKAAVATTKLAFAISKKLLGALVELGTKGKAALRSIANGLQKMNRLVRKVGRSVKRSFGHLGTTLGKGASALRAFSMGMLPATFALKKGVTVAADFEQQMGVVSSKMRLNTKDYKMLEKEAKRLGIVSAFSGKQSAEAMQQLGQAGLGPLEVFKATRHVLAGAAAEDMELANAASIVANNLKAWGMGAGEAGRVTDVLALASSKANTTMSQLGEALVQSSESAHGIGMSFEETVATLSMLGDVGKKGGAGGTVLKNALMKLVNPTSKGKEVFKKLGLTIEGADKKFVGMESILRQVGSGINRFGGPVKQVAAGMHLFGLRGKTLLSLLPRLNKRTAKGALTMKQFTKDLKGAKGEAAKMAKIRLDNLLGQLTLLKSSLQGATIEIYGPMMSLWKDTVKEFIGDDKKKTGLNGILVTVMAIKEMTPEARKEFEKFSATGGKMTTIQAISLGIVDAIDEMKVGWKAMVANIKKAAKWIGDKLGKDGVRSLTKMAIKFLTIAGAIAPILLGVGLIALLIKMTLIPLIGMLGAAFKMALGPVGLMLAGLYLLFTKLGDKNVGVLEGIKSGWLRVVEWFKTLWTNRLKPFIEGFWETFKPAIYMIYDIFESVFSAIGKILAWFVGENDITTKESIRKWKALGSAIGAVMKFIVKSIKTAIQFVQFLAGAIERAANKLAGIDPEAKKRKARTRKDEGIRTAFKSAGLVGVSMHKQGGIGKIQKTFEKISKVNFSTQSMRSGEFNQAEMSRMAAVIARGLSAPQLQQLKGKGRGAEESLWGKNFVDLILRAGSAKHKAMFAAEKKAKEDEKVPEIVLENNQKITVDNKLCVDRKKLASAMTRHTIEVHERTGASKTPWTPRVSSDLASATSPNK